MELIKIQSPSEELISGTFHKYLRFVAPKLIKRPILKRQYFPENDLLKSLIDIRTEAVHFFFYRQLNFSSEPGVANEILENEPKRCLVL